MNKNILVAIIVVLVVVCIGEGYLVYKERNEKVAVSVAAQTRLASAAKQQEKRPTPPKPFAHGTKFAENPLSQKAYLIAPVTGDLSADAQKALTGWDVKQTKNTDGSVTVSLTPKDADDIAQQYTVKPGSKLYFLEMTFNDESDGTDKNRGDDTGILVDANGMVE